MYASASSPEKMRAQSQIGHTHVSKPNAGCTKRTPITPVSKVVATMHYATFRWTVFPAMAILYQTFSPLVNKVLPLNKEVVRVRSLEEKIDHSRQYPILNFVSAFVNFFVFSRKTSALLARVWGNCSECEFARLDGISRAAPRLHGRGAQGQDERRLQSEAASDKRKPVEAEGPG